MSDAGNADNGKVPLHEQADEAHRELAMRHRVYPGLVKRGKMTASESTVAISRMRAIRDTLRLFSEFETEIRIAMRNAIQARRVAESSPVAQTVLAIFPEALPLEVRDSNDDQPEFMGPDSGASGALFEGDATEHLAVEGPAP